MRSKIPLPERLYNAAAKEAYAACGAGDSLWRVDTDEAITMEDCVQIEAKLRQRWSKRCFSATGSKANSIFFS